ncbi:hypothetical protein J26TS2_26360 [Shouchella clausii]|nr:hypothetical protein J26TS2_26360 [Shouchella clausii]
MDEFKRIEAVLEVVGSGENLMVDVSGGFALGVRFEVKNHC